MKKAFVMAATAAIVGSIGAFVVLPLKVNSASAPAAVSSAAPSEAAVTQPSPEVYEDVGFRAGEAGLSPSARAGREIWYKATAGNERFHTYVFQQRVNVFIDWFRVLRADQRDDRFKAWGAINDPSCCVPGSNGCPAKSLDETYGFDWCPGDQTLLQFVGKQGYRDPACDFKDAALDPNDVHSANGDQRQSACDLKFGTSTGALGYRKFPNPKFNPSAWVKLNGRLGTWEGFNRKMQDKGTDGEAPASHLQDGSVEPPFLIGTTCGSCHIAFDPRKPPDDPAHPQWENIVALVGNQYARVSEIIVSGMPRNSLEWQVFAHARPGTSDTSAIPTDQINNPGTINALINMSQRPIFANESIIKWRKAKSCEGISDARQCWCEPGRSGKCWKHAEEKESVHHILKGGEDSIGALEAIQRVYFNIGSCSEQCWMNHLTDLRQLDPQQRNFGQSPFDIGQCRRDCPNFRAIEDRLPNILDFFTSAEGTATDLHAAREHALRKKNSNATYTEQQLFDDLNKEFGSGAVARGEKVFVENCASCHSNQPDVIAGQNKNPDFRKLSEASGLREDWMGSDVATPISEVGTFTCRSLHSNHMAGRVWQEYGSETLRARKPDANLKQAADGGRSYLRNISLLSVWAHAPFMHNNAVGPELCGNPQNKENDFYDQRPRYVDPSNMKLLPPDKQPQCFAYDPSVEGRFKLYVASMEALLNPDKRQPKVTLLSDDIVMRVGPRIYDGKDESSVIGLELKIPKEINGRGVTAGVVGNFQHKEFIGDLVLAKTRPADLETKMVRRWGETDGKSLATELRQVADEIVANPTQLVETLAKRPHLARRVYSACDAEIENDGHRFGQDLSDSDKKALIAFLATL